MKNSGDSVFGGAPVGGEEAAALTDFLDGNDFSTNTQRAFKQDLAKFARWFRASKKKRNAFSPKTVYWVVNNIFREFAEQHPDRKHLTPHALRRRAITLVATATQSVDATAQAIGLNPATARRYYLDSKRAFDSDEVFRKMSAALIPKSPTIPPLNPNSEPQKGTDTNIEPT